MYNKDLDHLIEEGLSRINSELRQQAPFLSELVIPWMKSLGDSENCESYFKNPDAYPILLLPWWAEETIRIEPDTSFQSDIVYSTINGYYYIRLIDDLMDSPISEPIDVGEIHRHRERLRLLPALNFFHTRFQSVYYSHFNLGHPFWDFFTSTWTYSAEVTTADASFDLKNLDIFEQVAARKPDAIKIPVAAVFYKYNHTKLIDSWCKFLELFGCWHQLLDDMRDWAVDIRNPTKTFFLSEADIRKRQEESLNEWLVREGFDRGEQLLHGWMRKLKLHAASLGSSSLADYLNVRDAQSRKIAKGLRFVTELSIVIRGRG